jgi:aspartate-semialdehyde dehydrogenase
MSDSSSMKEEDRDLIRAQINKMMAETMKIGAETTKILQEQRYYPMIALGSIVVSAVTVGISYLIKLWS